MDEKEILLGNISNSTKIMEQIQQWETELLLATQKQTNVKKLRWFVLASIICVFIVGIGGSAAAAVFSLAPFAILIFARITVSSSCKIRINKANKQLEILRNDPVLFWLPPLYRHSNAFNYIAEYVVNMRANTLQEALNLYETEQHQARVELYSLMNKR